LPGLDLGLNLVHLPVERLEMIHQVQQLLPEQSGQFVGWVFDDL